MTNIISNSYTIGITLTPYSAASTTSVTSSGTITTSATSSFGLYAPGGTYYVGTYGGNTFTSYPVWTITNAGAISATGSASVGVMFGSSRYTSYGGLHSYRTNGVLTNSGTISGWTGVYFSGSGTVHNSGTITGVGTAGNAAAVTAYLGVTVYNSVGGSIEGRYGIKDLYGSGGSVSNQGTIVGTAGPAIYTAGVVTNSGGIIANGAGTLSIGVRFANYVNNQSGGLVQGVYAGVYGAAAARVTNGGNITSNGGGGKGVWLANGGTVVNNAGGQISGGGQGVWLTGGGSVVNSGHIYGSDAVDGDKLFAITVSNSGLIAGLPFAGSNGIVLTGGGTITNSGVIAGAANGIDTTGSAATIINMGTGVITAAYYQGFPFYADSGTAILLGAGGTIVNEGTITSVVGVDLTAGGTVINSGRIVAPGTLTATGLGVYSALMAGGSLTNSQSGYIGTSPIKFVTGAGTVVNAGTIVSTSGAGIYLDAGGTVIDAGTISGVPRAVYFGGSGSLLALEQGYRLSGSVYGGSGSTLELAGSVGAAVTVSYNGLSLSGFGDVLFGAGGYATLAVSNVGGTLPVTISGFIANTETIDLSGVGADGTVSGLSSTSVTITGSLGSEALTLDGSDATSFTTRSDGAAGTDVTPACFVRGTRIATPAGETAVEELRIGDAVVTLSGEARTIRWIGWRAYDGRFIAGNRAVLPIRIAAGALADGVPARDLRLSPAHSLCIGGVLVPAEHLVNGATIVPEAAVERVEYFHIELDSHDVILADGAPAESYVDCDNRPIFANAADHAARYPNDERPRWLFCLPRLDWGDEQLTEIREALLWRAADLGHDFDTDPDLHLVVDGLAIRPDAIAGDTYRFTLEAGERREVRLASRASVPGEIVAASRDIRRLGVPLERVVLSDADLTIEVWHGHGGLCDGFHGDEEGLRWTDGYARLPEALLRPFAGSLSIDVHVAPRGLPYRLAAPAAAQDAA